jgi:MFS family permease
VAGPGQLALAYAAALALGIASAFAIPAGTAILPQAVPASSLQKANGLQMGARQLSLLAGPCWRRSCWAPAMARSTPPWRRWPPPSPSMR